MKTTIAIVTAVVLGTASLAASAQTPTRMPDQDLKQQIAEVLDPVAMTGQRRPV